MHRNVTIYTIAKRAGVSRGTVDRVLNQRGNVNPQTEERIRQAILDLEYIPKKESQLKALGIDLPEEKKYRIGILLSNEQGYFRTEVLRGIKRATETLQGMSAEVLTCECKTALADEVVEQMENMHLAGVDGLILNARNQREIAGMIDRFAEKEIPVITINTDITDCKRVAYVGQNTFRSGRIAGALMAKLLQPSDKVVICIGNREFIGHLNRVNGFREKMSEAGFDRDSMGLLETHNDFETTKRKLKAFLEMHPGVRGIYMANRSVSACAEVIREMQLTGKIFVISHDLTETSRRLLKSGELEFVISQDLFRQAYTAVLAMYEFLKKGTFLPDLKRESSIGIYCMENCDVPKETAEEVPALDFEDTAQGQ